MDKIFESQKGRKFLDDSWGDYVDLFLSIRNSYFFVKNIRVSLPFGYNSHIREFGKFIKDRGIGVSFSSRKFSGYYPVSLFVEDRDDTRIMGLEQEFPGKVMDVFIQGIPGYSYRWSNKINIINISKYLATTNIAAIEVQIGNLLSECNRFRHLYTEIVTT